MPTEQISTHAPRTGSDDILRVRNRRPDNFNPRSPHGERQVFCIPTEELTISTHAPRTGSDLAVRVGQFLRRFQPTLPARGATMHPPRVR